MKELKFLEYFEVNRRSGAINILLKPIRAGVTNIKDVIFWLERDCNERIKYDKSQQVGQMLLAIQDKEALQEAINYYIDWEKLPFAEKEKIKKEKSKTYIENAMAGQQPTEKQVNFIESKGFEVPGDKLECSRLITKIIQENL